MLEQHRTKDILIGVMAIAMIVVGSLVAKQMLNADTSLQSSSSSVEVSSDVVVATSSVRSFKNSAELEAFLKSDDPQAVILRTYLDSAPATSTLLIQ